MRKYRPVLLLLCLAGLFPFQAKNSYAQQTPPPSNGGASAVPSQSDSKDQSAAISGMYSFLKDGEFLQVTVEDEGRVTGFISRFGDGESDKGAFLDQFFKNGKLDGKILNFTTEQVHGTAFDFHGTVERGDGKNPGDEAYFLLKGTLTKSVTDVNKKISTQSQAVVLKSFPQDAGPAPAARN